MTILNYQKDSSAMIRIEMWQRSIELIGSDPLLGIGPANFEEMTRGSRFPHGMSQHEAYWRLLLRLECRRLLSKYFRYSAESALLGWRAAWLWRAIRT